MIRRSWCGLAALLLCACPADDVAPSEDGGTDEVGESETTEGESESGEEDTGGPPPPPADAPDELGPVAVGYTQLTAVDPERDDRTLLVDVWYPAGEFDEAAAAPAGYLLGGLFTLPSEVAWADVPVRDDPEQPLVIFSHGYRGISTQSFELCETLASHGFIVVAPEHTGNSQADPSDDFDTAAGHRVPDVSFLLDLFEAKEADAADMFHGRIGDAGYGVVGHSFGGMTSVGAAAGWAGAPSDPRVTAIAPISAVIDGDLQSSQRNSPNAGFTAEQLASITVPVMLLGGTEDVGVPVENNALAFEGMSAASSVYRADIIGANHTHFSNVCTIGELLIAMGIPKEMWEAIGAGDLIGPYDATCGPEAFPIEEAVRLQNLYVVAFLRRHMLGEAGYDHYLSPEYADTEAAIIYWERER